jgi:hypothetical protein
VPIVALLITGLVCLAVGLLLSSTTWLVVSLVASIVAGLLLYRSRELISVGATSRSTDRGRHLSGPDRTWRAATVVAEPDPDVDVWVVDGRPRYHREGCDIIHDQPAEPIPLSQATEDGFIACSLCEPDKARAGRGA